IPHGEYLGQNIDWPTYTIHFIPDNDGIVGDPDKTFFIRYTILDREACGSVTVPWIISDSTINAIDDDVNVARNSSVQPPLLYNDQWDRHKVSAWVDSFTQPSHGTATREYDINAHAYVVIYTPDPD